MCEDPPMAPNPSVETEVAEFTGQLFFRLWRAMHTQTAAALQTIGLTPALFALLNYLQGNEGAIQQHIVHFAGEHKNLLPNFVGRLTEIETSKKQDHQAGVLLKSS